MASPINKSFCAEDGGCTEKQNESSIPTVEGDVYEGEESEDTSEEEGETNISDADSMNESDVDDELRAIREEKER